MKVIDARIIGSLRDAEPTPLWLDRERPFEPQPPLNGDRRCDLAIVGGGFTGLWTALLAKERDPSLEVAIVEADVVGGAASGRNGGFCMSTLTHGIANGAGRWPAEMARLEALGLDNLRDMTQTLERHGIDCAWRSSGEMQFATESWQVEELREDVELAARFGRTIDLLDRDAARAEVDSPTYLAATWDRVGCAMVDPALLAWGLARACMDLGVRILERTRVTGIEPSSSGVVLTAPSGRLRAGTAALGTSAFRSPLRRLRLSTVPVYDYVLATEPIPAERWEQVGWRNHQGIADAASQFHYAQRTVDDRIVWGGYDAVYHFGSRLEPSLDQRAATFELLAKHFFQTFPQLEGVRFTHTWGGAIDTCTRFAPFFGTAMHGRVAYALGYTGMGVGASRFGAQVMLDLLGGRPTELTRFAMVRSTPVPFPPEPLRWAGIWLTRRSIAHADAHEGRRDLWLRALDRFGIGFDS